MSNNYQTEFWQAYERRHTFPDVAVRGMMNARDKAREIGDHHTVLEYNHWILQTLIFNLRDIKTAYPLAVATAVEARKDIYQHQQEHICVYQDLILTYLDTDPLGHETLIEDALDYMQAEVGNQPIQCRLCLQGLRVDFHTLRENWDQTEAAAFRQIDMAETSWSRRHHQSFGFLSLAEVAWRQGDWQFVSNHAQTAAEMSQNDDSLFPNYCCAELLLALYHLHQDEPEASAAHFRRALAQANSTGSIMSKLYYDLLRAYYEQRGEIEAALKVTDEELTHIKNKGLYHRESLAHIARCRLLKTVNRLTNDHIAAAEAVIKHLKQPTPMLHTLQGIQAG